MKKELSLLIFVFILFTQIFFVYASMNPISSTSGNKQDYSVEIQLVKGWTLVVGTPVGGSDSSAITADSEIQQSDIEVSFYYSRNDKKYLEIYPNSREADNYLGNAQTNVNEISYFSQSPVWIYSDKAGILKYTRKDFPKFYTDSRLSLTSGWNLVTIIPEISSKTFNDIKGNCNAEKLYFYIGELNRWLPFDLNNSLFGTEDVGKGFLVKVTSNCSLGMFSSSTIPTSNTNPPLLPNSSNSCSKEVIVLKEKTPQEFIQLNRTPDEFSYLNHEAILEEFYKTHSDNYDFMIVAPQEVNFQSHYSFPVNKNITGIGADYPQSSPYTSRLMSFTLFEYYRYYKSVSNLGIKPQFMLGYQNSIYHEIAHHWCCTLKGVYGELPGHWTNNLDLFGGSLDYIDFMGYKAWVIKNGQEYCIEENDYSNNWKFSNLTLYLMGLIGKESVNPIQVHEFIKIEGNEHDNIWGPDCQDEHTFTNTTIVTIQDIISQNGARVPNTQQSKKDFNVVFVDIVPYGEAVDYEYIKYLKEYMRSDEWYEATSHKSTIKFCN